MRSDPNCDHSYSCDSWNPKINIVSVIPKCYIQPYHIPAISPYQLGYIPGTSHSMIAKYWYIISHPLIYIYIYVLFSWQSIYFPMVIIHEDAAQLSLLSLLGSIYKYYIPIQFPSLLICIQFRYMDLLLYSHAILIANHSDHKDLTTYWLLIQWSPCNSHNYSWDL